MAAIRKEDIDKMHYLHSTHTPNREGNMNLQEIVKSLKSLSYSDLAMVQSMLTKYIYAKGVEDYLTAIQMKPFIDEMSDKLTPN